MSLGRWNACRYPVFLHQLKAMCPGRVPKDDKWKGLPREGGKGGRKVADAIVSWIGRERLATQTKIT
jgi:hypothetical protein